MAEILNDVEELLGEPVSHSLIVFGPFIAFVFVFERYFERYFSLKVQCFMLLAASTTRCLLAFIHYLQNLDPI